MKLSEDERDAQMMKMIKDEVERWYGLNIVVEIPRMRKVEKEPENRPLSPGTFPGSLNVYTACEIRDSLWIPSACRTSRTESAGMTVS